MKLFAAIFVLTALMGCESMPDTVKDDGHAAGERARANADDAFKEMKEDTK
jgi:hypothetical protein